MINLDQMEREARARLARKLSVSVAHHMRAILRDQLPPDVLHFSVTHHAPPVEAWTEPCGRRVCVANGRPGRKSLQLSIAAKGRTAMDVLLSERDGVYSFERIGVPGAWLLRESWNDIGVFNFEFDELVDFR